MIASFADGNFAKNISPKIRAQRYSKRSFSRPILCAAAAVSSVRLRQQAYVPVIRKAIKFNHLQKLLGFDAGIAGEMKANPGECCGGGVAKAALDAAR